MNLPKIRIKIILFSSFAVLFANIIGAIISTLSSSEFVFKHNLEYYNILKDYMVVINIIAFGFAIISIFYNYKPLFKKNATIDNYRLVVINLPITIATITLLSWIIAFIANLVIISYHGLSIKHDFIIPTLLGIFGVGIIASVISYFYQDFFNKKYLIPLLFSNKMEQYKEAHQPSIRVKFYIYFLAVHIAPMMFFGWVFLWIRTQTDVLNDTQFIYIFIYGIFALLLGVELTIMLSRMFHEPLTRAKYATQNIIDGNYNVELAVNSTDEMGILSERINTMVRTLQKDKKEIEALNQEIEETQKEVVFTMGAIGESRSKETGNHVKRVAEYSKLLALRYGLSKFESELLKQASPMHDIGKVAIADNILNKPGKFTNEEFEIMKNHAILGYEMINKSDRDLLKIAAIVAYEHHEKWDGSGYPRGISGKNIHIYGRITAIADVFDALGSDRVYKSAWSDEEIFKLFKDEKGKHFDPELVDIFFENLDDILKIRDKFKDNFYNV